MSRARLAFVLAPLLWAGALRAAPVQLTFYQRGYLPGSKEPATVVTEKAVALFEDAEPQVRVRIVGLPWTDEGTVRLEEALESGEVDVLRVTKTFIPHYAKRGWLSPIGPYLKKADWRDYLPGSFDSATYRGKIYAWPLWVAPVTIVANTEILHARGVRVPTHEVPWSYEEFVSSCRRLTYPRQDGAKVYGFAAPAKSRALFYIDGGRILSPDAGRFLANRKKFVSALTRYAELKSKHNCVPDDFAQVDKKTLEDRFLNNRTVALLLSTPGFIRDLQKKNFPLTVLPLPVGDAGKLRTTGSMGFYAVTKSKNKRKHRAAHRLARWLTGSEVGRKVTGYQRAPGLRRSNKNLEGDSDFQRVARSVRDGVYEPPSEVPLEVWDAFFEGIEAVVRGEKSAQTAMDEIALRYRAALRALRK